MSVNRGNRLHPRRHDRNRWELLLLGERIRRIVDSPLLPAGRRVFDYGCGNGPYRSLLGVKFVEYIGGDLPGNYDADLVLGSRGEVPVEAASFDCVVSSQVLEHVADPREYLKEVKRILRADGHLILSTHGTWPYHPHPADYWRWTLRGLEYELERAGFRPIMVQSVLGPQSTALQMWQDFTTHRLPRWVRPVYTWLIQWLIGRIEGRYRRDPAQTASTDASTYVVLAKKESD